MTIIASVTSLFFAIYLSIQAPPVNILKAQPSVQHKQATGSQPMTHTPNVTATQAISPTKQAPMPANSPELYRRVAARSLGESSVALAEIACTIKNRLRVSRASLTVVLRAYYARDRTPKPEHIEVVRKVFEGELPCPATWWYALSPADTRRFRPHPQPAMVIKHNSRAHILIYDH